MHARLLAPALLLLPALALAQDAPPAAEAPAAQEAAAPTTYTLKSDDSDLWVIIRNDTDALMSRFGHDHVIAASSFTGSVTWPAAGGDACKIDIAVPVTALVVDPPGSREAAGLDDNTISDGKKKGLKKNMWGKSQLFADSFPKVTFSATSCSGTSGKVKVKGTMSIRGKSVPVTVTMDVKADAGSFTASGRFKTSHTAFGFEPFSAMGGGLRNQDALEFRIAVKGTPSP